MPKKKRQVNHQFGLFGFQRPIAKVPISAARILQCKLAIEKGDSLTALQNLRIVRDRLENFERNL